ncbi:MAG: hypothetical protein U5Q03_00875 [Bacteroidota bacterium]|nr:hypothetical protein [Bacteroidota bacterium]
MDIIVSLVIIVRFIRANLAGHVELGENVTIGMGSTVFNNVKVGTNSIIGGGSVVTKDIPENALAFGNPCKVVQYIKN